MVAKGRLVTTGTAMSMMAVSTSSGVSTVAEFCGIGRESVGHEMMV